MAVLRVRALLTTKMCLLCKYEVLLGEAWDDHLGSLVAITNQCRLTLAKKQYFWEEVAYGMEGKTERIRP